MARKPKVTEQQYELVGIDSIKPHPDNPRRGDVDSIAKSISANGFYGAIVAQKSTGRILAGNHRWVAAKQQGFETVPVIYVDVNDVQARKILLADNRTNDKAGYDNEVLAGILSELSNQGELEGTGYGEDDLNELINGLTAPNFEPGTEQDQGRLDQKKPFLCPECGHEFTT